MKKHYAVARVIDPEMGSRALNACWFLAGLGISTFQLQLLAQSWLSNRQALVPACIFSTWVIGSLFAVHLPNNVRLWGSCLLISVLAWLEGTRFVSWHTALLPHVFAPLIPSVPLVLLVLLALFLGALSSAWLSQRRPWPPAGERTSLARGLVSTMGGLFVVWVFPAWSGLIGIVCVLPLLALDFWPVANAPQPVAGGVVDAWVGRYWSVGRGHIQFDELAVPWKWRRSYLAERLQSAKGYLPLTLLASCVTVLLGGLWGAVPTPFAGGLFLAQTTGELGWLLAGQLGVLVIGACCFRAARHVVGNPNRLLPEGWRRRARCLAVMALFVAGTSLFALGLPSLQAPWWLAVSLASYTFALSLWGTLLPRLRLGFDTKVFAQRHLLAKRTKPWGDSVQLAFERAQEERVYRALAIAEGMLIAIIAPAIGGLINLFGSVDTVLVILGAFFVLVLACSLLVTGFRQVIHQQRQRSQVFTSTFYPRVMGNPWNAASRKVSPAF